MVPSPHTSEPLSGVSALTKMESCTINNVCCLLSTIREALVVLTIVHKLKSF